jgi:LysR family hydrogen peroxide-inducible transcriptional activator
MTLTELRYIVAVAQERHFGRAADRCFVSQPTLSVAVRKLEEELGIILFERGKNEVTVTPEGERIIAQAQRVLEEAECIKRIAEQDRDPLAGPLRLGIIYTVGPYLLTHLIPILREQVPQMTLLIEEDITAKLSERVKQGELDVIIISLPFHRTALISHAVYDEPFVVLLPSGHPWNQSSAIAAQDLAEENLLLLGAGHCFRDQVLQVCPACSRSLDSEGGLQRTLVGGSLETIRHMVASGMGITVLPCSAAGAHQYSGRIVTIRRFQDPVPSRRVALVWRKSFPRPLAVKALRQAILTCGLTCVQMLPEAQPSDSGR